MFSFYVSKLVHLLNLFKKIKLTAVKYKHRSTVCLLKGKMWTVTCKTQGGSINLQMCNVGLVKDSILVVIFSLNAYLY